MDHTQDTRGPDVRALQALLDGGATGPKVLLAAIPADEPHARPCIYCGDPVPYRDEGEPWHPICRLKRGADQRDREHRLSVAEAGDALMVLAAEVERLSARDPLNDDDRDNDEAWPSSEATQIACLLREQARQADERRRRAA